MNKLTRSHKFFGNRTVTNKPIIKIIAKALNYYLKNYVYP